MKKITLLFLFLSCALFAQVTEDSELYKTLKAKDSLLFKVSFNTCDLSPLETLLADDLEFYHDKSGITNSKKQFIDIMKNGLCKSDEFVSRRVLIEGSLEVFPLYNNGKLYGAIQKGVHQFFEKPKGRPENTGSIAKFTHLWLLIDGQWKISRVLSYDHKLPDQ